MIVVRRFVPPFATVSSRLQILIKKPHGNESVPVVIGILVDRRTIILTVDQVARRILKTRLGPKTVFIIFSNYCVIAALEMSGWAAIRVLIRQTFSVFATLIEFHDVTRVSKQGIVGSLALSVTIEACAHVAEVVKGGVSISPAVRVSHDLPLGVLVVLPGGITHRVTFHDAAGNHRTIAN